MNIRHMDKIWISDDTNKTWISGILIRHAYQIILISDNADIKTRNVLFSRRLSPPPSSTPQKIQLRPGQSLDLQKKSIFCFSILILVLTFVCHSEDDNLKLLQRRITIILKVENSKKWKLFFELNYKTANNEDKCYNLQKLEM